VFELPKFENMKNVFTLGPIAQTTLGSIETRGANITRWPCHLHLKSILRQKKNYENSNISPCKKYNVQKNLLRETKILQDIILTLYN